MTEAGPRRINPYLLPEDQHGWRGLTVPGHHKRKWYTVVQNDHVLVTALLLMPGERSIRHSHESGELSIRYTGEMNPIVTWVPPGLLHPVDPPQPDDHVRSRLSALTASGGVDPPLGKILEDLLAANDRLSQEIRQLEAAAVRPRIIIDVLFPPFKTTIDDPNVAEKKTVVGQWYD